MFKLVRWLWRKAQMAAAQVIIVYIQKNQQTRAKPVTEMPQEILIAQPLEDWLVKRYIMPSRQDDFDMQRITVSGDGLSPIISPKISSREKSGRDS